MQMVYSHSLCYQLVIWKGNAECSGLGVLAQSEKDQDCLMVAIIAPVT